MRPDDITPIAALDIPLRQALLDLNNRHEIQTSFLDAAEFDALIAQSFAACAIDTNAFVIALDQGAHYDSPYFRWQQQRYDRFVYIDRIVTDEAARGRGLARRLYETVFERAAAAGHARVVCEVNRIPPNPGSKAFHARMGFADAGELAHPSGRTVTFMSRGLASTGA